MFVIFDNEIHSCTRKEQRNQPVTNFGSALVEGELDLDHNYVLFNGTKY